MLLNNEGKSANGGHGHGQQDEVKTARRGSVIHSPPSGGRRLSMPTLTSGQEAKHLATTANSLATPVVFSGTSNLQSLLANQSATGDRKVVGVSHTWLSLFFQFGQLQPKNHETIQTEIVMHEQSS